jgi:hypothetical protein
MVEKAEGAADILKMPVFREKRAREETAWRVW